MSKKHIYTILIVLVFLVLSGWLLMASLPKNTPQATSLEIDKFAQCLTEKGVIMYGAYWCPHCQNQKRLFGDSFQYIKYVECTQDVKLCEEKKIQSYPTWDFADGSRQEGEMTFDELSQRSSCQSPK